MTGSLIVTEVHLLTGDWRVTAVRPTMTCMKVFVLPLYQLVMKDNVAIVVLGRSGNLMLIDSVIWTTDGMMTGDLIGVRMLTDVR
jgi:hypothetical protein